MCSETSAFLTDLSFHAHQGGQDKSESQLFKLQKSLAIQREQNQRLQFCKRQKLAYYVIGLLRQP
jgi:hypothetical protein